jgi:hypothetical protein
MHGFWTYIENLVYGNYSININRGFPVRICMVAYCCQYEGKEKEQECTTIVVSSWIEEFLAAACPVGRGEKITPFYMTLLFHFPLLKYTYESVKITAQ